MAEGPRVWGRGQPLRANHSQAEWELHCGWGLSGKRGNPDQSHASGAGPDRATGPISAEGAWPGSPWPAGTAGSRRAAPRGRSAAPGTAGRAQAGVRAGTAASASPRLLPWPGRLSGASGNAPREDALCKARVQESNSGVQAPHAPCSVSQGPGTPGSAAPIHARGAHARAGGGQRAPVHRRGQQPGPAGRFLLPPASLPTAPGPSQNPRPVGPAWEAAWRVRPPAARRCTPARPGQAPPGPARAHPPPIPPTS